MTEKNWRWKKLAFVDISKNQHQVLSIFKVMFIWKCDFIDWKISIEIEKSKLAKLFYLFYRKFYHKWDFFPMYRGTFHPISASTLCHREKFNFQKKTFPFLCSILFSAYSSYVNIVIWRWWSLHLQLFCSPYGVFSLHDSCMLSSKT